MVSKSTLLLWLENPANKEKISQEWINPSKVLALGHIEFGCMDANEILRLVDSLYSIQFLLNPLNHTPANSPIGSVPTLDVCTSSRASTCLHMWKMGGRIVFDGDVYGYYLDAYTREWNNIEWTSDPEEWEQKKQPLLIVNKAENDEAGSQRQKPSLYLFVVNDSARNISNILKIADYQAYAYEQAVDKMVLFIILSIADGIKPSNSKQNKVIASTLRRILNQFFGVSGNIENKDEALYRRLMPLAHANCSWFASGRKKSAVDSLSPLFNGMCLHQPCFK